MKKAFLLFLLPIIPILTLLVFMGKWLPFGEKFYPITGIFLLVLMGVLTIYSITMLVKSFRQNGKYPLVKWGRNIMIFSLLSGIIILVYILLGCISTSKAFGVSCVDTSGFMIISMLLVLGTILSVLFIFGAVLINIRLINSK